MDLLSKLKIDEIYRYNSFSEKEIIKELNNLSEEKKKYFSDLEESLLSNIKSNLNIDSEEKIYGEITEKGVYNLAKELSDFSGVFYDIGSGNGKLIIHLSIISGFSRYVGVEKSEVRYLYSKKINLHLNTKVELIHDDILNVNINDANFIFMNDMMFSEDLRRLIYDKIPKKCYFLSFHKNEMSTRIKDILINVTWMKNGIKMILYKK